MAKVKLRSFDYKARLMKVRERGVEVFHKKNVQEWKKVKKKKIVAEPLFNKFICLKYFPVVIAMVFTTTFL